MKNARKLLAGPGTRSVENVHHLRLMALLKDMVRELGPVETAETLGLDRKTIWRSLSAGRLSPRLADAVERLLLAEGVADSQRQRERMEALELRVDELAGDVEALAEELRAEIDSLRERDYPGEANADGRSVVSDALRRSGRASAVDAAYALARRRAATTEAGREYPDLVTREPAEDDERVYGDAWPLVAEWRRLDGLREVGTKLDQAGTRERVMELEIEMIEERGLTLPPATTPMHPSEMRDHLGWRRRALDDLRRERARRETLAGLRTIFTFGRWRG